MPASELKDYWFESGSGQNFLWLILGTGFTFVTTPSASSTGLIFHLNVSKNKTWQVKNPNLT